MPKKTKTCGATVETLEGALTCGLGPAHDGPVHDDHGHQWGDPDLTVPLEGDPS